MSLRRKIVVISCCAFLLLSAAVATGFYVAALRIGAANATRSRLMATAAVARTISASSMPWYQDSRTADLGGYDRLSRYLSALVSGEKAIDRLSTVYLDPADGALHYSASTTNFRPGDLYPDTAENLSRLKALIAEGRDYSDSVPVHGTAGDVQLAVAALSAPGIAGSMPGGVILQYNARGYYSLFLQIVALSLLFGGGAFALSLFVIVPLTRHIVGPIGKFQAATARVSGGDLTVRIPIDRSDEFGDLANDFNTMVSRLQISYDTQKQQEERLRDAAYGDELTGLENRKAFFERVEELLLRSRRSPKSQIHGLLFIDLDDFHAVNDSQNHSAGDAVLVETAHRLTTAVRQTDHVFRLTGDEFAVMLLDLRNETDASIVARKILEELARPFDVTGGALHLTASIGIALFPRDALIAEALIREADSALADAKQVGDTFRFFSQEMQDRALFKMQLVADLHEAVEREEFVLAYQPIVASDSSIVGAEALVRWNSPARGLVSPADFIPLAEETGIIIPLGTWIIGAACRQLRKFHQDGMSNLCMSVNLSPRQLNDPTLPATIVDALVENDLSPSHLILEITESSIMDQDAGLPLLERLRELGIAVSIDDFGTGYSSLSRLNQLPIDDLKIDRSFVVQMDTENPSSSIVASIITLAHSLDLEVVVEGVETTDQATALLSLGCDYIQGYIYSPPLGPDAFTSFALNFCERGYVRGA